MHSACDKAAVSSSPHTPDLDKIHIPSLTDCIMESLVMKSAPIKFDGVNPVDSSGQASLGDWTPQPNGTNLPGDTALGLDVYVT